LIRHGQASFLADDYDVLSERGVEQSRRLGRWAAEHDVGFDRLYSGPRLRQRDTARHVIEAARAAGHALPEPVVVDAFDEFPFQDVLRDVLPRFASEYREVAELLAGRPPSNVGSVIEQITGRWARGELAVDHRIETYEAFRARVLAGLDRVMSEAGRGTSIAVVTSGGPISIALRRALALDHELTWKTAWQIRNTSLSEFKFRADQFTFVAFNSVPHLPMGELVTYR
jgi:broad specificity phosphatase PhoE